MKFHTILSTLLAASASASPMPKKGAAAKGGAAATNSTVAAPAAGGGNATTAVVLPDGRIKKDAKATDFNVLASVFKSAVVKGDGLVFSDLIVFPDVKASIFDGADNKPFEITINDKSVFVPKGGEAQSNVRRADLLPSIRSTLNNVSTTGVKTMHFSVQTDVGKPINTTHDYQLFNLESADFSFHQLDLRTGAENAGKIVLNGNSQTAGGAKTLFSADFKDGEFSNFAIKMDFDKNTVQVFHSTGDAPLKSVTDALANDLKGNGEYHFALQKNPVGDAAQPTGIDEGIIFGGIFMEDSASGTVTLQ